MSYQPEGLCRIYAHRWLHELRGGQVSSGEIRQRLAAMEPDFAEGVKVWLRHWQAHTIKPPKIDR